MSLRRTALVALALLGTALVPARAQVPVEQVPPPSEDQDQDALQRLPRHAPVRWVGRDSATAIRSASRDLKRQMDRLKKDLGPASEDRSWRALSYDAEDVSGTLGDLEDALRPGLPRQDLYVSYGAVQNKVRALVRDARASDSPAVKESLRRVTDAERHLRAAVFDEGVQETWDPQLVGRLAENLVHYARDLERQGQWSVAGRAGRRGLQDDLHALTDAVEEFRRSALNGDTQPQLMRDFGPVEDAWARVAPALGELPSGERLTMRPRAERVDDALVRLHRRLGLRSEPVRLADR